MVNILFLDDGVETVTIQVVGLVPSMQYLQRSP
jgi:hypothetical protein